MSKNYAVVVFLGFSLMLLALTPLSSATTPLAIPNLDEITVTSIGLGETVDPAWAYDTASAELVMQVYDTLIGFNWEDPSTFIPELAELPVQVAPLMGYAMRVEFTMRAGGVKWHDGTVSDAADLARHAEYTFERWMFLDRTGGPTWMIYEALFGAGTYGVTDLTDPVTQISAAVDRSGAVIGFNFKTTYPLTVFYQVIAQSWSAIINKEWAVDNGAWDGAPANWATYYDPPASPFDAPDHIMMGTGPFSLDFIDYLSEEWRVVRFADYWGGWPAPGCSDYVDAVHEITIYDWADRKPLFLSNSAAAQCDLTVVNRANIHDPDLLAAQAEGEVSVLIDLPTLTLTSAFFNFAIPSNSPYAGDGSFGWTTSVPQNFFADPHVRYGFAYAFDYNTYLTQVFLGEASQPATFMIQGLMDDLYNSLNPSLKYNFDMNAAKAELQQAHGGALWANGFTFTITYNSGNAARLAACTMMKTNIESLNAQRPGLPPFKINVQEVPWSTYLSDLSNYPIFQAKMVMFQIGWQADYPDPHNFAFPFFHSNGDYAFFQSYSNPTVDALIEQEITETDQNVRTQIFGTLMTMWKTELPSLPLSQARARHYERTWVQGWYYNPIEPINTKYRRMWKGLDGDVTGDGTVDILDAAAISAHWYPGPPIGPLGYARYCDIWPRNRPDRKINMMEVAMINYYWGDTIPP